MALFSSISATSVVFNGEDGREIKQKYFWHICNNKMDDRSYFKNIKGKIVRIVAKCHYAHHFDPYLTIGPFHIEIAQYWPLRSTFHDFFTASEMDWMMTYSRPKLSMSRQVSGTEENSKSDRRYNDGRTGYSVSKTVQTWLKDIIYNEEEIIKKVTSNNEDPLYEALPLKDRYSYTVEHTKMVDISKRIEMATRLNLTTRHGASNYQTTNYGLAGLVERHIDPWGYEQGTRLPEERKHLATTGDYIATFMGWLQDVQAGGGTVFPLRGYEGVLKPKKGSGAFWINLTSCHKKDPRSLHGGCPVLKGSKWIVNKWMYSWDQWKTWPCHTIEDKSIDPFEGMSSFDYR